MQNNDEQANNEIIINVQPIYDINNIDPNVTREYMSNDVENLLKFAHWEIENDDQETWLLCHWIRRWGDEWTVTIKDQSLTFPDPDDNSKIHIRYQRNELILDQDHHQNRLVGVQEAIVDTVTHEVLQNEVLQGEIEIEITPVLAEIDYKTIWCWDAVIPPVPGVFTDSPSAGYGKGRVWFSRQNNDDQ